MEFKEQPTISRSNVEKVYKALKNDVAKEIWVDSLLKELTVSQQRVPILLCDNLGATYLTTDSSFHAWI
jgi:hypothetical protein